MENVVGRYRLAPPRAKASGGLNAAPPTGSFAGVVRAPRVRDDVAPILLGAIDPQNDSTIDQVLEDWNLNAIRSSTFAETCAQITKQRLLLVFCDLSVSENGLQSLLQLIHLEPRARIVALIPESADERISRAVMQMGAFNVIVSPCRRSDVQWTILFALRDDAADDK